MIGDTPKKMLFPCVLKLLRENTDGEEDENGKKIHAMTQKEIIDRLASDYDLKVERKSFGRNLKELMAFEERIHCTVKNRRGEELLPDTDDEGAVYTDFWFDPLFEKGELQAIVYNVVFGRHISAKYKRDLVRKLESLHPFAFRHNFKNYIQEDKAYSGEFNELFLNMEELDSAITDRKPVRFRYTYYRPDKTVYTSQVEYVVIPLGIVAGRGDYYLLSCPYALKGVEVTGENQFRIKKHSGKEENQDVLYFMDTLKVPVEKIEDYTYITRLDRITNLKILEKDEVRDDKNILRVFEKRSGKLKAQEYAALNADLSSGRTINASFRLTTRMTGVFSKIRRKDCDISDVIDYFGKSNVTIREEGTTAAPEGKQVTYLVYAKTNDGALRDFAKANIESVEILTPEYMRDELRQVLKTAYERMRADGEPE